MLDQNLNPIDPMSRYSVSTQENLKLAIDNRTKKKGLTYVSDRGWLPIVCEPYTGAWQLNNPIQVETALSHPTVYACVTQIASDIGKLRLRLTELKSNGIWTETESPAFSPVLRKPNHFQTRQKFIEYWLISKLSNGNAYILKERDARGIVRALYVLDPTKVRPLVADNGDVFYSLSIDHLSGLPKEIIAAPAYEIIHDMMECLFHPLVGIPPIYGANLAATQGINIQTASSSFFGNNSRPSGILTAPGTIAPETADRLKTNWQTNFTGTNSGNVAVLGDGLKYEAMSQNAVDSQLVEQLKWSDEKICSVYKVPPYKVYVGPMPTYDNAEVLDKIYYASCLQRHIEAIEALLDEGLGLKPQYATEFDLEDLMRMDSAKRMQTAAEGVKAGILSPNEGRRKFSLPPVKGGDTPYLQQQDYSLAALAERDANKPFKKEPPPNKPPEEGNEEEEKAEFDFEYEKMMRSA